MILLKRAADLKEYLNHRPGGTRTGFVPTMGALHGGHRSLIEASRRECGLTVCSIFVNPTQFNDPQDFARYPVTLDKDILLLEQAGCDILFLPSVNEMYPVGMERKEHFDLGPLETVLEGKFRPGHFQGVCQVVKRLLEIVEPHTLFLGRKDYQQCMVINRLIGLCHFGTRLFIVPTLREESGLAMSSRNLRLTEKDKVSATAISRSLLHIKQNLRPGVVSILAAEAERSLRDAGFEPVDYVAIADAATLEAVDAWNGHQPLIALVAATIGGVRLIDNLPLDA